MITQRPKKKEERNDDIQENETRKIVEYNKDSTNKTKKTTQKKTKKPNQEIEKNPRGQSRKPDRPPYPVQGDTKDKLGWANEKKNKTTHKQIPSTP